MTTREPQEPDIADALRQSLDVLAFIRQNRLLDEGHLIRFSRDRGVAVSGVVTGDPSRFHALGWLPADDSSEPERPLFHPFRIHTLNRIIAACRLSIAASSSIDRGGFVSFVARVTETLPTLSDIGALAARANRITDLAILLEPLYWPSVTSRTTWNGRITFEEYQQRVAAHRESALNLVRQLDLDHWREQHENLRWDAHMLDGNDDVYVLLRLAPWSKRERVTGKLGGALWLRHMAEVVRRGFEEGIGVVWPEEDEGQGTWFSGARERIYGSARPLENVLAARPNVAFEFGLHTGSTVRWYLEGDTEYSAVTYIMPKAAAGGIELMNLRGAIAAERDNAPLKLADALNQDQQVRRFSFLSFDMDVPANVRAIRRQIEQGRIVGYVAPQRPDFEFSNFSLAELVEIAARFDDDAGFSADVLRHGDWSGVSNARQFADRYCSLSARQPRSLKGEEWGIALAKFAADYPDRGDNQQRRPFLATVEAVLRARRVRYEDHRDRYILDPNSFELIEKTGTE